MVENQNGTYEFVYAPTGTQPLAWLEGQTLAGVHLPLPGGAFAVYNGSGRFQYNHADWLGSARLFSTPTRTASMAMSYAPFGEGYASGIQDIQFTSYSSSFTVSDNESQGGTLDDFTFRRYSPVQGRWISPDPAGLAAVDPGNPQSWNRYAYALNNPLRYTDRLGLDEDECNPDDGSCEADGGGDGGNGSLAGDTSGNGGDGPVQGPIVVSGTTITVTASGEPIPGGLSTLTCTFVGVCQGGGNGSTDGPVFFAGPLFPGMNGPFQAAKNAANWFMKKAPTNTDTIPGAPNKPPEWPGDFQSEATKAAAAGLDALGDLLTDILIVVDPCLSNPDLRCGPYAPPQL
jgi:RHS repeat-associated protein